MQGISTTQEDAISNALLIGMAREDAFVYAGLSPQQIADIAEDEEWQSRLRKLEKEHEYDLLARLKSIITKQERAGKEGAVTWALEHMYPRYSNKPQEEGKQIIINFADNDPADDKEVVEICGTQ